MTTQTVTGPKLAGKKGLKTVGRGNRNSARCNALPKCVAPLTHSLDRERHLTERRLHRLEVLAMIRRRARRAGLPQTTCCHTFRATGITTYLQNGGTIEHAQQIANHESPRTTKLYDRTNDAIGLDEIERILI
jgi:integrase/recombinase XerD